MEDLEIKLEDGGLRIEDRHSRFEDLIMSHLHLTHVFLFIFCHCKAMNFLLEVITQLFPGLVHT